MGKANPTLGEVFARALVIAKGYAHAGTHEEGGNNLGDQVAFFQRMVAIGKGAPWCAAFVYTCLVKAFAQLMGLAEDRDSLVKLTGRFSRTYGITRTGYCPTLWAALHNLGLTRQKHERIPAGSIVFYDLHGQGEPHHVGWVSVDSGPDALIFTIEGNTPAHSGNQADGDGVYARSHSRDLVFGFGVAA